MLDNFIGGGWLAPKQKRYLEIPCRRSGVRNCRVPRSSAEDLERAFDEADRARETWSRLEAGARAVRPTRVADQVDDFRYDRPTIAYRVK